MSDTGTASRPRRVAVELRALAAAVAFLTRLPVGNRVTLDGDDVTRAGAVFPLVGAGIGAAVGLIASGLAGSLSPLLACAVAVAAGTLVTGALHIDALADTADACGAHTRERALAIMRDSTIGAFGATAIALDLLIKTAALAALVADDRVVGFALAAGALSRCVPVALGAALPYARSGEGAGVATTRAGAGRATVAGALAIAVTVAVDGVDGAVLAAAAAALAAGFWLGYRRWLAGVTGDGLGAAVEVTETALLVIAVALVGSR